MTAITTKEISREQYDVFLNQVDHSIYHKLEWLNIIENFYHVKYLTLGFFSDKKLVAVAPLQSTKIGPLKIWGFPLRKTATPPAISFCAPERLAMEVIEPLHTWVESNKINYLQLTLPSNIDSSKMNSCEIEKASNLEIDLTQPLSELQTSLSSSTRRNVRKGIRQGVKIHWKKVDIIDDQKLLLLDTYQVKRNKVSSNYPIALYKHLLDNKKSINLRVISASLKGKTLASIWVFTDKNTCYYWDASSRTEARDLRANHLLVWCLIRWAYKKKLNTFDFVGGEIGGQGGSRPGIGRFKRSMGGTTRTYQIAYWYSPFFSFALKTYRAYFSFHRTVMTKIKPIKSYQ